MAQQVVLMPRPRARAVNLDALTGLDVHGPARFLIARKQLDQRNPQPVGQNLQRVQGRRNHTVFDLGQHPHGQTRFARKIRSGHPLTLAQLTHLTANRDL